MPIECWSTPSHISVVTLIANNSADPLNAVSDLRLIPYLQILEFNPPSSLDYSSRPGPKDKAHAVSVCYKNGQKDVARCRQGKKIVHLARIFSTDKCIVTACDVSLYHTDLEFET